MVEPTGRGVCTSLPDILTDTGSLRIGWPFLTPFVQPLLEFADDGCKICRVVLPFYCEAYKPNLSTSKSKFLIPSLQ